MKKERKLAFSAVMAGLSSAFMLLSRIPSVTYAVPAVSGLFIMIILFEAGRGYALAGFVCSVLLNFFVGDITSSLLFVLFFGYYPILKAVLDKTRNKILQWVLKALCFSLALALGFFAFKIFTGLKLGDLLIFGKHTAVLGLAALYIVFALYDIALSQVAGFYFSRVRSKIRKYLK